MDTEAYQYALMMELELETGVQVLKIHARKKRFTTTPSNLIFPSLG
jgi:hypothetical protein